MTIQNAKRLTGAMILAVVFMSIAAGLLHMMINDFKQFAFTIVVALGRGLLIAVGVVLLKTPDMPAEKKGGEKEPGYDEVEYALIEAQVNMDYDRVENAVAIIQKMLAKYPDDKRLLDKQTELVSVTEGGGV